jgi:hypothetical protein
MAISMNIFGKMMFGMGLANAILMALSDSKLTAMEITQILQFAVTGLGTDFKLSTDDFQIVPGADGSISLVFSKKLVEKLQFTM